MLSLVYVSSARQLFSEEDLKALLEQSRDKNKRLGVTGLLQIYASIQSDARHHEILELIRQQIQEREFSSWSMGFKNLKDVNLNEPLNSAGFKAEDME